MNTAAKPYIGGQAVIEGVMMRSQTTVGVAVRKPDGTIVIHTEPTPSWSSRSRFAKWPLFRGVAVLAESLALGYRALNFSAQQQMTAEEQVQMQKQGKSAVWISALLAVGLFVALPQGMTNVLGKLVGWTLSVTDPRFHAVTGGFKLLVLLSYLALLRRIPEVARVFQYHGAEHKTIYAYEKGLALTVPNARAQSTLHPRCGTTFLVVVIVVSIVVGSVVTPLVLPPVAGWLAQVLTFLLRVALLPLIAAISYEIQRFEARYCTTGPLSILLWPGYLFQKITTREPDDAQLEVAIAAMKAAIPAPRLEGA